MVLFCPVVSWGLKLPPAASIGTISPEILERQIEGAPA